MNVLLVAWFDPHGTSAILEHINKIRDLSVHNVEVFNTFNHRSGFFNRKILLKYQAIIFHNTVSYNPLYLRSINNFFFPDISLFRGVKVLMKQDEMKLINETIKLIDDWDINVLTSCLDKNNIGKVYDEVRLKKLIPVHTLTGYVSEYLLNLPVATTSLRDMDVVYRGMESPFEWGKLGYEKFYIGEGFKKLAENCSLKVDISSKAEDRIYGENWFRFLAGSKATLAVESGASIFDFTGEVEEKVKSYREKNPAADFIQASKDFLAKYESDISYNQISPRHLEATACKTVQIMFEGEYSGIFIKDRHYISLEKDFSNMDEVVEKLRDENFCDSLCSNAINEILKNPALTFDSFIYKLDLAITNARERLL